MFFNHNQIKLLTGGGGSKGWSITFKNKSKELREKDIFIKKKKPGDFWMLVL